MEAAAPARLSGLAKLLLRRPPSLRELVTLIGYADDYAWFAGLVHHLFPDEGEALLVATIALASAAVAAFGGPGAGPEAGG